MPFHTVAKVADVREGDVIAVEVEGVQMVLCRVGGKFYALQRKCLHAGADLSEGIVARGFLICSRHAWKFHVDTGRHELSPQTCLMTFAVRVTGDDVQVDPRPQWRGEVPT
jgi:nitrite reductase/ring-hydroxylating ferredoxin subunit